MLASGNAVISVIVPVRRERPEIARGFARFSRPPESELLVAAGDGDPETIEAFAREGARIIAGDGPRGARLALAAREARGEILFFLHADSTPPANALEAARETLENGATAGAFSLAYDEGGAAMRWVAWWANLRSRWLKLPFGDQGIFCRREAYERAGGFRELPICDDLDLVRRLRRTGRVVIRPEKTVTSARRYLARGAARQVLRTWRVLFGYFARVDPRRLERWYNRE
jgi:rSAM/selenodomain-associated transferase 2